jgi:hypothetical protein
MQGPPDLPVVIRKKVQVVFVVDGVPDVLGAEAPARASVDHTGEHVIDVVVESPDHSHALSFERTSSACRERRRP